MTEWVAAVREIGLLALLVGFGFWAAKYFPQWVERAYAAQESRAKRESDEREKDRRARHEVASMYTRSVAEMYTNYYESLTAMQERFEARSERLADAIGRACRYEPTRNCSEGDQI